MSNLAADNQWQHCNEASYDTTLITGALLWADTKKLASLILEGTTAAELRALAIKENLFERKSKKTALNILSYLRQRLSAAPTSLLNLIAYDNSLASKQAVFIAAIQSSRFLREFISNVVCDKLESFNPELSALFWEDFWSSCISKDHSLQNIRPKTVKEIRSNLLKFLVELEILESSKSRELKQIRFQPQILQALSTTELACLTPFVRSFVK